MQLSNLTRRRARYGIAALLATAAIVMTALPANAATPTSTQIKWSQPYVADDLFHGGGYNWSKALCTSDGQTNVSCPAANINTGGTQANFHDSGYYVNTQESGIVLTATSNNFTVPKTYKKGARFVFSIPVQLKGSWTCSSALGTSQLTTVSKAYLYNDKNKLVAQDLYSVEQDCGARTKIGVDLGAEKDSWNASIHTDDLLPVSSGSFSQTLNVGVDSYSPDAYASKSDVLHAGTAAHVVIQYFVWGLAGGPVAGDMNLKNLTWSSKPGTGSIKTY